MFFKNKNSDYNNENYSVRVSRKTLRSMGAVLLSLLIITLPISYIRNDCGLLAIHLIFTLIMTANLWSINRAGNMIYSVFTIILPSFSVLLYALIFAGTIDSISWFFIFPVMSFFFLGKRLALFTNLVLLVALLLALGYLIRELPEGYISIFIHGLSYFSIVILCYLYESHREDIQNKLVENSLTDYLTGSGNRRGLEKSLLFEIENHKRYNRPFCLIILDIDDFKKINDSQGHSAGDSLLKEICSMININLRNNDSIYRMGGDEFAIILQNTKIEGGLVLGERIVKTISSFKFIGKISVSISAGIASSEESQPSPDEIMRDADVALYIAKNKGKNRIERSKPNQK